jgi:hypothetical protein
LSHQDHQKEAFPCGFHHRVFTIARYLANPELDRSKCISFLTKLCLKPLFHVMGIGSFIMAKSDDHSLIILHSEGLVHVFDWTGWENHYGIDRRVETKSISLTSQGVDSLRIISCETRRPELCVRGWRMYLWIRQHVKYISRTRSSQW